MRRWLALYAVAVTSLVVIAFVVPLGLLVRDLAADRALASAERDAQTIARVASAIDVDDSPSLVTVASAIERGTILRADGVTFGAAVPSGFDRDVAITATSPVRSDVEGGAAVAVPIFRATDQWAAVVFVPNEVLMDNVVRSWVVLGLLGMLLVGLAALVADRLGRAITRPIDELVVATHQLGTGDVAVRVRPTGPAELKEVGQAFNQLTERVGFLLEGERRGVADLAHRLRTPLTALKLNVEGLADNERLIEQVDTLERTVSQIIVEGRRPIREGAGTVTDLVDLVPRRASFWGALAEEQERSWTIQVGGGPCEVRGSADDVEAVVDALLGNIFAHTPVGTAYSIQLSSDQESITLEISDEGPGFADVELLERGRSGADSTGLGSDIVRTTVEASGGSVDWEHADGQGTSVTMRWEI